MEEGTEPHLAWLCFNKGISILPRVSVVCYKQLLVGGAPRLACVRPVVTRKPSLSPRDRNVIMRALAYLEKSPSDLMKI